MGEGTVDHAPVCPREVMRRALEAPASACCPVQYVAHRILEVPRVPPSLSDWTGGCRAGGGAFRYRNARCAKADLAVRPRRVTEHTGSGRDPCPEQTEPSLGGPGSDHRVRCSSLATRFG